MWLGDSPSSVDCALIFSCPAPMSPKMDESTAEDDFNVPVDLFEDLLIVISAPRWHLLLWLLDWADS